jgi:hypothetical protein
LRRHGFEGAGECYCFQRTEPTRQIGGREKSNLRFQGGNQFQQFLPIFLSHDAADRTAEPSNHRQDFFEDLSIILGQQERLVQLFAQIAVIGNGFFAGLGNADRLLHPVLDGLDREFQQLLADVRHLLAVASASQLLSLDVDEFEDDLGDGSLAEHFLTSLYESEPL